MVLQTALVQHLSAGINAAVTTIGVASVTGLPTARWYNYYWNRTNYLHCNFFI